MRPNRLSTISFTLLAILAAACGRVDNAPTAEATTESTDPAVTAVTRERLVAADQEQPNWLTHGRTYDEQRFSPLAEINKDNVDQLRLAWYFDVPTNRGMEATPIVVDGRMYVTGSWSIVYALDAATGEELWSLAPTSVQVDSTRPV